MSLPRILQFHDIQKSDAVGAKAEGLVRLINMGLEVPPGFVLLDAQAGEYPSKLEQNYWALGGAKVVVYASVINKNADDTSLQTLFNIDGVDALKQAIDQCLTAKNKLNNKASMVIVVQEMVEARSVGHLFTADPENNRRDRIVIDAIIGNSETLAQGKLNPDHYVYDRNKKKLIVRDLSGAKSVLNPEGFRQLVADAEKTMISAVSDSSEPLSMEWAIDQDGDVCWLHAQAIAAFSTDLNELDSESIDPSHIFTPCNAAEVLPGAQCPLTLSLSGNGLNTGMQRLLINTGVITEASAPLIFGNFFGHLFVSLSAMAHIPRSILGLDAGHLSRSICGHDIPELNTQIPKTPFKERRPHLVNYLKLVLNRKKIQAELQTLSDTLDIPPRNTVLEHWQVLNNNIEPLNQAFYLHHVSSMNAEIFTAVLLTALTKNKTATEKDRELLAALLVNTKSSNLQDLESAHIAQGASEIQQLLLKQSYLTERFINVSPPEAYSYLRSADSGLAGKTFFVYLKRHGHRSNNEMDLRTKEWASNPMPLIQSLQTALKSLANSKKTQIRPALKMNQESNGSLLDQQNIVIKLLTKQVHKALAAHENSKSLLVKTLQKYKVGYRQLAQMMVAEELIQNTDQIYFFTHKELGEYVRNQNPDMLKQVDLRRKALVQQQKLFFPNISVGAPQALKSNSLKTAINKLTPGETASRGYTMGRARVVRSFDDASKLKAGDILITPVIDLAWAPYFGFLSGIASDMSSVISHGAIAAREYGLPALTKTATGTQTFKDDDIVVLNANEGSIRLATEKESVIFDKRKILKPKTAAA